MRTRGPDLLSIDNVMGAIGSCRSLETGEVAPGIGLRESLATDVFTGEDPFQKTVLLVRPAPGHDGWACHSDPYDIHGRRQSIGREFLQEYKLLDGSGA